MTSIYENQKIRVTAVLTRWQSEKLKHYAQLYGLSVSDLFREFCYELRLSEYTQGLVANPHRDICESSGRVLDRLTERNELEGRFTPHPSKPPPHLGHREGCRECRPTTKSAS